MLRANYNNTKRNHNFSLFLQIQAFNSKSRAQLFLICPIRNNCALLFISAPAVGDGATNYETKSSFITFL